MTASRLSMMPENSMSDEVLIKAIARHDVRAFEALYLRHWHAMLTYLVGQLGERSAAEDVLQEVMLAVWHGAQHFRGEASVRTWLFAIARRQALQSRQCRQRQEVRLDDPMLDPDPGPSETVEKRDHLAGLQAALTELPAQQREVIELIFYHGLTGPEVALATGVALGTVKSRLRRAKMLLQRLLRLQEFPDA